MMLPTHSLTYIYLKLFSLINFESINLSHLRVNQNLEFVHLLIIFVIMEDSQLSIGDNLAGVAFCTAILHHCSSVKSL